MPQIVFRPPPPTLAPAVEVSYRIDAPADDGPTQHFPIARPILVFTPQGGWTVTPHGAEAGHRIPDRYITGMQTGVYTLCPLGDTTTFGVVFHPTTVHKVVGLDMATLVDETVGPDVLGAAWAPRLDDLQRARDDAERWALIETALAEAIADVDLEPTVVDRAVDHVRDHVGDVRISDLAEVVGVSERTLERRFRAEVGLSPKQYARQVRFLALIGRLDPLDASEPPDWMEIMTGLGYYDQSHFYRDFTTFAGCSPSAFIEVEDQMRRQALGDDRLMDRDR